MKGMKGRRLGTKFGQKKHDEARSRRAHGAIEEGLGLLAKGAGVAMMATGDVPLGVGMFVGGAGMRRHGSKERAAARGDAARATATEGLIAKGRGGSAALGQKGIVPKPGEEPRRDHRAGMAEISGGLKRNAKNPNPAKRVRDGAAMSVEKGAHTHGLVKGQKARAAGHGPASDTMSGGGGHDDLGGGSGSDTLASRTVADKYRGAKSAPGKRIMDKAQGERSAGKYWRGLGHVSNAGAGVAFATGNAPAGVGLLSGASASYVAGRNASDRAESLRLKSRAVDSLVNKARSGNTLGAPGLSPGEAGKFAVASHAYNAKKATESPATEPGGWQNVGDGKRGFGNPNNQAAAQKARQAKGFR